jgi:hypothetical protein
MSSVTVERHMVDAPRHTGQFNYANEMQWRARVTGIKGLRPG